MFRREKIILNFIFLSIYFVLLSGVEGFAQPKGIYSKAHGDSLINKIFTVDSKKEAEDEVAKIVSYTGLTQNFQIIENTGIPTARAYIKKKQRYIEYNPQFMLRVKDRTKSDWGSISVLAHEIGHHLSGHTLTKRNRSNHDENIKEELDADKFSGFIMYKMGASLDEAKLALNTIELNSDPATHPQKTSRLVAITLGWLDANKLEERYSSDTAVTNLITSLSSDSIKFKKRKPFVYKCVIYGDKNYYFVDEKNQVLSIDNSGEPYVVGYKVKSHDASFDWIFSVQSLTYGVDSRGKMWSKTYAGDLFVVGRVYNIER